MSERNVTEEASAAAKKYIDEVIAPSDLPEASHSVFHTTFMLGYVSGVKAEILRALDD